MGIYGCITRKIAHILPILTKLNRLYDKILAATLVIRQMLRLFYINKFIKKDCKNLKAMI